jgi:hypothetical protein
VAGEDFHRGNRKWLIDDKVNKNDKTIHTSNVPDPPDETATSDKSICRGALIFDPSPHQLLRMKTSSLLPLMPKLN